MGQLFPIFQVDAADFHDFIQPVGQGVAVQKQFFGGLDRGTAALYIRLQRLHSPVPWRRSWSARILYLVCSKAVRASGSIRLGHGKRHYVTEIGHPPLGGHPAAQAHRLPGGAAVKRQPDQPPEFAADAHKQVVFVR